MKGRSIKRRLYSLILIMIIPIFILQIFRVFVDYREGVEKELNSNREYAEAIGVSFGNYLDRIWDTELSIGLALSSNEFVDDVERRVYMYKIALAQPSVQEYDWIDSSGVIVSSSNPAALGVSLQGLDYIERIMNGEERVVSELINSRVNQKPTFVIARAIRRDGKILGIVAATIDINKINLVLPAGRASAASSFGLVDNKGTIVYQKSKYSDKIISGASEQVYKDSREGRRDNILADKEVLDTNWKAYARTSNEEIFRNAMQNIAADIGILILMIIICVISVFKISKSIVEPITILQGAAQEISMGNFNIRTNILGDDEIASAAQAFDKMAVSIEEYDNLKTQFFSTISHELKTPLNIILASLQMMGNTCKSKYDKDCCCDINKYSSIMTQNCYRLLRLINNLIDINRLDSGYMNLNLGNNDIVSVVEDITLSISGYAESKGIDLIFDTEVEERIISCDPEKIERIMLNLLSNSIKFTNPGGNIYVNMYEDRGMMKISVRDTGIGIPHDKRDIIFERFRQVDSTLHRKYQGSGIGLSLVKALVEAHGGRVYLNDKLVDGTEFIIELPITTIEEDAHSSVYSHEGMDRIERINIEFSDV